MHNLASHNIGWTVDSTLRQRVAVRAHEKSSCWGTLKNPRCVDCN